MGAERIAKLFEFLRESPGDLFLQYALAMEYIGLKEHAEAEKILVEIISSDPVYVPAFQQLGQLYEHLEMEDRAIETYQRGIAAARIRQEHKAEREMQTALDALTM